MEPYYQEDGITIYHGDCRDVLPGLAAVDSIITDPVWPNASQVLVGSDRPYELFAEVAALFPGRCARAAIQLGCDSDPRILTGVPSELPYFRTCWLEYACPTRKGRVLYTGDIAYIFGVPPASRPGRRVLSGRYVSTKADAHRTKVMKHKEWGKPTMTSHPTPRRYQHVHWLVSKFADGPVLDPFCGSGTTLLAAKNCGYEAIGIEIEERWCEQAAQRLTQRVLFGPGAPPDNESVGRVGE